MIQLKTKYIKWFDGGPEKCISRLNTTHLEGTIEGALCAVVSKVGVLNLLSVRVFSDGKLVSVLSPKEVVTRARLNLPKELIARLRISGHSIAKSKMSF